MARQLRHALLLFLLSATCALCQTAAPTRDTQRKVGEIFSQFNHTTTPGCAVGATAGGHTVVNAGYGMADLEHGLAITPDTIFEAGSVSKQFTAAAVLLLAQQGKLSIDDYARKYLPELSDAASTVTIRHMLNHTAGLRDWGSVVGIAGWPRTTRVHTHAHVLDVVSRQKALNYAPGAAYSYSNTGYNLAAILVSRVAGQPFAEFTRNIIFTPLGMASTLWRDNFKQIVRNRAVAYTPAAGSFEMDMPFEDVHGNGGLLTTVGDLLRWNTNFDDPKVGGPSLIAAQHQQAKLTDGRTIAYAAGLRVTQWKGRKEVSHSGATAGYRAWLGRYPDHKLSVAVLCNVTSANAPQLGHRVADLFLPAATPPAPVVSLDSALLQAKAGLYRSLRDGATLSIAYRNGQLSLRDRTPLRPISPETFLAGEEGQQVIFQGSRITVGPRDDDAITYERVEPVAPSLAELQPYTGQYASEEAETSLNVAIEGGQLSIHRRPDARFLLTPTYRDSFSAPSLGTVRFLRDNRGQVTQMIIGQDRVWNLSFSALAETLHSAGERAVTRQVTIPLTATVRYDLGMSHNHFNRRLFLGSAAAASALAQQSVPANDRISLAFVGVGVMGAENLGAAMNQPGVAVSAVCDVYQPNLERAAALAHKRGHQPKEVRDFREILADKSIDAVCISTPDHWHPYMAVEACKAGKDVYVEKPACVAVNEGAVMIEAARRHNRVVQAGTWQRSGEHFQKACDMVRNGELGKIAFARSWIYSNQPQRGIGNPPDAKPPAGLDWDLWQGPAQARPFNPNRFGVYPKAYSYFRFFWDYAGGQLTDSGIHMLDIIQMALGDAMPRGVVALGGKFWFQDDTETPDTMQATFEYPGLLGCWEHRSNNTELTQNRMMGISFHGTRGTLYVDRSVMRVTPEKGSDLAPFEMKRVADPHPLHWANFVECVRTRKRPNSDIETCVRSSITSILGNLSLRARTRLDWDDQRKTVEQEAARGLLHREYRAPWKLEA